MIKNRCPYHPWLRDVRVRRIYIVTLLPLFFIIVSIAYIVYEIVTKELPPIFSTAVKAFKDGESYD
jgi:hypothetical protein